MTLDNTNRKILNTLQDNARMSNADLAEAINLSPSACLRRVRQMESDGIISGYALLMDQVAIGKPTSVFVEVTLQDQSEESLESFEEAIKDYSIYYG